MRGFHSFAVAIAVVLAGSTAAFTQPIPVVFIADDAQDDNWENVATAAFETHRNEGVPLAMGVIPCANGSSVSSQGEVTCVEDTTPPIFHENFPGWIQQTGGAFEVVLHGTTHHTNERLANYSRARQLEIMSIGLERMATWNLPRGLPVSFNTPFASANADTISVAEQLGLRAFLKASRTFSLGSDQLDFYTYPVLMCRPDSNGQPVDGAACVFHGPGDLVDMVKARAQELADNDQNVVVTVLYHVQDLLISDVNGQEEVDPAKVAALEQILRRFRQEEAAGAFDLTNYARLAGVGGGTPGDGPIVDFDGDLATDFAVYRPSNGTWYVDGDHDGATDVRVSYGAGGDLPVPGDYDGDGNLDVAVYRPSMGRWFVDVDRDGASDRSVGFGTSGDIPVPGDFDGDGTTDFAVYRPSTGIWYVDWDRDGVSDARVAFGTNGDVPLADDFDGDGLADLVIFRPSSGTWFVDTGLDGTSDLRQGYGARGDVPVPGDYDGDGALDVAVFRPSLGRWFVDTDRDGTSNLVLPYGAHGDVPTPGDYDGDGVTDVAVFRRSTGVWYVDTDRDAASDLRVGFGTNGDVPIRVHGASLDAAGVIP